MAPRQLIRQVQSPVTPTSSRHYPGEAGHHNQIGILMTQAEIERNEWLDK